MTKTAPEKGHKPKIKQSLSGVNAAQLGWLSPFSRPGKQIDWFKWLTLSRGALEGVLSTFGVATRDHSSKLIRPSTLTVPAASPAFLSELLELYKLLHDAGASGTVPREDWIRIGALAERVSRPGSPANKAYARINLIIDAHIDVGPQKTKKIRSNKITEMVAHRTKEKYKPKKASIARAERAVFGPSSRRRTAPKK